MNYDDATALANHIIDRLPDDFTSRFHNPGFDEGCYMIENKHNRLAIGIDPVDGEGISWAVYAITGDGQSDDIKYGGWAFGDAQTAGVEIDDIVAFLSSDVKKV
jgi:hypothetical protein